MSDSNQNQLVADKVGAEVTPEELIAKRDGTYVCPVSPKLEEETGRITQAPTTVNPFRSMK